MSYEVLARKWRPQRFEEVVGQDHVIQTLERAITTNRVAHAYLFVGPRGTGKTTTARILAKALNCMNRGGAAEPCNQCDSCKEITGGTSLDVIEIDGASNNGVEQVRELRENVLYAPARGPYKVYIIDEVHMLSTGAFNALLKTLEEPPAHAVFILATTDVHKVPSTILSRCQRFDLQRIGLKGMVGQLRKIAKVEEWTITEDALLAIARGAEGGLRDAESALDQLISFRGTTIDETDVLNVFGLVSWTTLDDLTRYILGGDTPAALRLLGELDENGRDLQRLVAELLGYFRNLLIFLHAPDMAATFDMTEIQLEALKQRVQSTDAEKLLRVIDLLTEAANSIRFALSRRTLVEVAFIKASRAAGMVSIDELIRQIQDCSAGGDVPAAPAVVSAPPAPVYSTARQESKAPAPEQTPRREEPEATVVAGDAPPTTFGDEAELEEAPLVDEIPVDQAAKEYPVFETEKDELHWLEAHWPELTRKMATMDQQIGPYLRDSKPVQLENAHLVVGFDPEFSEDLNAVNRPTHRQAMGRLLHHELGHPITVKLALLASPTEHLPSDHTAGEIKNEQAPRSIKELADDPIVIKTVEYFAGDVFDIRN